LARELKKAQKQATPEEADMLGEAGRQVEKLVDAWKTIENYEPMGASTPAPTPRLSGKAADARIAAQEALQRLKKILDQATANRP